MQIDPTGLSTKLHGFNNRWFWNTDYPSNTAGDIDGDGIPLTLADIARYYYVTDLSTLPNTVAPNAWDPATWQHMVTYTLGFGIAGV